MMSNKNVQYEEIVVDLEKESDFKKRAETLLQIFLERTNVPLTLPFLTHEQNGEEKVVLFGFMQSEWESFFGLSAENPLQ